MPKRRSRSYQPLIKTDRTQPPAAIEVTKTDIFVVFDGVRIAKRGRPGTPQARTWISLEPGFTVLSSADLKELSWSVTA
jgi:hypothetical protein